MLSRGVVCLPQRRRCLVLPHSQHQNVDQGLSCLGMGAHSPHADRMKEVEVAQRLRKVPYDMLGQDRMRNSIAEAGTD